MTRRANALAAGAGALWALSSATATVTRIDPRTARSTDHIAIDGRQGSDAPPTAIAAAGDATWVLNGSTSTLSRIDATTREVNGLLPLGIDRLPSDIVATARYVWTANADGTLSRVDDVLFSAKTVKIAASLERVAVTQAGVWVATAAPDQAP